MSVPSHAQVKVYPRHAASVHARKVGGDTLVLHTLLKQYHVLNHVAGRIWDLADGTLAADEIAAALASEFRADEATVYEDVVDTLEALAALRIIEMRPAP